MGKFLNRQMKKSFEQAKPKELQADIRMISGCEDSQTSADVSNVADFRLPDPAGRAGGACTSTLLNIVYKDEENTASDLSYKQVLDQMRETLEAKDYTQIPQLTSSNEMDINERFDLVPPSATGTKRAVMIGINYIGHESGVLSGCHNDVKNMKKYIKKVHGFQDKNIQVLLDDGVHTSPTGENILNAYKKAVAAAKPGDALFFHYSGHGCSINDDDSNEEKDGKDEALVPLDYQENGVLRDDDLFNTIIKPLKDDVHLVCLMDCCHSGSILDLPYVYKANGLTNEMSIDENFKFKKLFKKFGAQVGQNLLNELKNH